MKNTCRLLTLGVTVATLIGCDGTPPAKPTDVEVTGAAKFADGKPVKGVTVAFNPTSGLQNSNSAKTGDDGSFKVMLKPGDYRFVIEPAGNNVAAYKAVPNSYKSVSEEHTVTVDEDNPSVEIILQ